MFENLVQNALKSYTDSQDLKNKNINNNIYNILWEFYNAFKNNEFNIPCNLELKINHYEHCEMYELIIKGKTSNIIINFNNTFPININPFAISNISYSVAHYLGKSITNINSESELIDALQKFAIDHITLILDLSNFDNFNMF